MTKLKRIKNKLNNKVYDENFIGIIESLSKTYNNILLIYCLPSGHLNGVVLYINGSYTNYFSFFNFIELEILKFNNKLYALDLKDINYAYDIDPTMEYFLSDILIYLKNNKINIKAELKNNNYNIEILDTKNLLNIENFIYFFENIQFTGKIIDLSKSKMSSLRR